MKSKIVLYSAGALLALGTTAHLVGYCPLRHAKVHKAQSTAVKTSNAAAPAVAGR